MLEIVNHSYFTAGLYPGFGAQQKSQMISVIKAGWHFQQDGQLVRMRQVPIVEADQYLGEPGKSSLTAASEIKANKAGSEIWLSNMACQNQKLATGVQIDWPDQTSWQQQLSASVPKWQQRFLGVKPEQPAMLTTLQLPKPLEGDGKITLYNLIPETESKVCLFLPKIKPWVHLYLGEQLELQTLLCDKLVLNLADKTLALLWRFAIPWEVNDAREGVILIRSLQC